MATLRNTYRNQSIAQKLILWVLILGASFMLIGAAMRLLIFHFESRSELSKQADLIAFFLEKPLQTAIVNGDKNYVSTVLKDIAKYPSIVSVALAYEHEGSYITINEISRSVSNQSLNNGFPMSKLESDDEINTLDRSYNLHVGDTTANLALILEHQLFSKDTTTKLAYNMLIEGFIILSITLGVLFFIQRLVTKHLNKISDFALNMSLETLPDSLTLDRKKSSREVSDELDHVVFALEHMRHSLIDDLEARRSMELALVAEQEEKIETKRLAEEAKASNKAKSQFIATMSHEIRTPMNGVIGMVEMLRDTPLNEDQQQYLDVIYRSSESLMSIINDILDYSKIESGAMVLENNSFDLHDVLDDCMQLFSATAQRRGLELLTNVTPQTPTHFVGDAARLRQILINLLGNAFKFTAEGHILIRADMVSSKEGKSTLHFSIHDSGIGIDESVHSTLFDAFKQADGSTTRKFGGTGLGLTICKQLVELMGGHIGLSSKPGVGSQFWFTCVFSTDEKFILSENAIKKKRRALNNKSLLLVHESNYIEEALNSHCGHYQIELHCCNSGLTALEHIHSSDNHFDFVVVNERIGKTSGMELAIAIRKLEGYKKVPIFLLSRDNFYANTRDENTILTGVVNIPINITHLIDNLENKIMDDFDTVTDEENHKIAQNQKLKVLVAEDNAINRMVIEGLLKKLEAIPEFCENGIDTISKYMEPEQNFDVIFMDCEMPEMDGFEATVKIREWEKESNHTRIPIIALTAHVESDHRQKVFNVGMDYYLSKPITYEKLKEALVSMQLA